MNRISRVIVPFLVCPLLLSAAQQDDELVRNGGFEEVDTSTADKPFAWELPDGLGVSWARPPNEAGAGRGKAIRMDTTIPEDRMVEQWRAKGITQWDIPKAARNSVSDTYGLSFYSDTFRVEPGCKYSVAFDFKSDSGASGAMLWVRGYATIGEKVRRVYETYVNCRVRGKEWTQFEQEFDPTKNTPDVREMRVMLFAYYPPGVYWFDNVSVMRKKMDASPGAVLPTENSGRKHTPAMLNQKAN